MNMCAAALGEQKLVVHGELSQTKPVNIQSVASKFHAEPVNIYMKAIHMIIEIPTLNMLKKNLYQYLLAKYCMNLCEFKFWRHIDQWNLYT